LTSHLAYCKLIINYWFNGIEVSIEEWRRAVLLNLRKWERWVNQLEVLRAIKEMNEANEVL
jgi:hypothetical protein